MTGKQCAVQQHHEQEPQPQHPGTAQSQAASLESEATGPESFQDATSISEHGPDLPSQASGAAAAAAAHIPAQLSGQQATSVATSRLDEAVPRGLPTQEASVSNPGSAPARDAGLYPMPEAVLVWAAEGAASGTAALDPFMPTDQWQSTLPGQHAPRLLAMPSNVSGISSDRGSGYATPSPSHSAQSAQHAHVAASHPRSQWSDRSMQPLPGHSHHSRNSSASWNNLGLGASHAAVASRDHRPAGSFSHYRQQQGQNLYQNSAQNAVASSHFQPHPYSASVGHQLNSNLESLDLANDSWQPQRSNQHQQQYARQSRPAQHGSFRRSQPADTGAESSRAYEGPAYKGQSSVPPARTYRPASSTQAPYAVINRGARQGAYPSMEAMPSGDNLMHLSQQQAHDVALLAAQHAAAHFPAANGDLRPLLQQPIGLHPEQHLSPNCLTDFERLLKKLMPSIDGHMGSSLTLVGVSNTACCTALQLRKQPKCHAFPCAKLSEHCFMLRSDSSSQSRK